MLEHDWVEKLAIQEPCARSKIFGQGASEDRLVKEGGTWLIAHRSVRTDRLVDDPERPVNLADPDVAALVRHLIEAARRLGQTS